VIAAEKNSKILATPKHKLPISRRSNMKNTFIRVFVLTLAVAGFGAATVASHARTTVKVAVAPVSVIGGSMSLCAPSDPSHCGMD
jgi:hypothetical protein